MKKHAISTISIALVLGAGASVASAQLKGSDTIEPIVNQMLLGAMSSPRCGGFVFNMTYAGGGSGGGETQLTGGGQTVAPMSRPLAAAVCTANATAEQLVIGLDGLSNVARTSSSCSGTAANNDMGPTGTWEATLRQLYFGRTTVAGTSDCNSAARQAMAANYATLFPGSCATGACDGKVIKHAWRRGDTSGTTDTFKTILFPPPASAPAFCNGTEKEDRDPIRRIAENDEQVAEFDGTLGMLLVAHAPSFAGSNDPTILYNAGVLETFGAFGSTGGAGSPTCGTGPYATDPTTGAAFPTTNSPRCDCRYPIPANFIGFMGMTGTEPDAQKFSWNIKLGAGCQSTRVVVSGTPRYGVLNGDDGSRDNTPALWGSRFVTTYPWPGIPAYLNDAGYKSQIALPPSTVQRCCGTSAANFRRQDPRVFNLFQRSPTDGSLLPNPGTFVPAYFRIKSNQKGMRSIGGAAATPVCQRLDATEQIGCLVNNSACSTGFAGMAVTALNPGTEAYLLESIEATDANVQKWAENLPGAYPFSRGLYLSSTKGFAGLLETAAAHTGSCGTYAGTTTPATVTVDAQYNLAKCLLNDGSLATSALINSGFVPLPGPTPGSIAAPYIVPCGADARSATRTAAAPLLCE